MNARWVPLGVVAASGFLLLIAGLYGLAYAGLPSDGAVVDFRAAASQAGLPIMVLRDQAGGLRTGDRVLAIEGRPVDEWLRQAAREPWSWPAPASALSYTVLRAGQAVTVRQALMALPARAVLRQYWSVLVFLIYVELVGLIVFVRRPRLPVAWLLLLLASSMLASGSIFFFGLPLSAVRYGWFVGLYVIGSVPLYAILVGALLHFSMVVWPSVRRPAVLGLVYLLPWPPYLALLAVAWPRALGASGHLIALIQSTSLITAFMFPVVIIASLVSYRRYATQIERRQMRWILWAFCTANMPWLLLEAVPQVFGQPVLISPVWTGVLWCAIPTAIAISILREGLFDIDVVINRSLVYSALTLFLAAVYFGSVVLLQGLFRLFSGEGRPPLVTVLSTLVIAALFSPVRQRVQAFIDQRFYRRKYDAARTLAAFGATVRDEVNFDELSRRLLEVVDETMRPAHASLWLRPLTGQKRPSNINLSRGEAPQPAGRSTS